MDKETKQVYELTGDHEKEHVFVLGNTKYLRDMNQKELAVLFANEHPNVQVKPEPKQAKEAPKLEAAKA